MKTSRFEFLVEEPSMEAFLNTVLPRMLPAGAVFEIHAFQGKQALLRKLEDRLKGYARFMANDHRIMVIVDQDNDDCKTLKSRLESACAKAGLRSKRVAATPNWQIATQIAIEELEAWYFGNWLAVCAAYPRIPKNTPSKKQYRNPDAIRIHGKILNVSSSKPATVNRACVKWRWPPISEIISISGLAHPGALKSFKMLLMMQSKEALRSPGWTYSEPP